MLRHILRPRILMHISDVMNRPADRIQQRRASTHRVIPLRHRPDFLHIDAVIQDLAYTITQHRRNQRVPLGLFLLFNHGIKATDGVLLQPTHRPAPVQDKNDLC